MYYTHDLTFYPSMFPYRSNPDRSLNGLRMYDVLAPHVIEGDASSIPTSSAPRRSARQQDYTHSSGQALRDIPDVSVPPTAPDADANLTCTSSSAAALLNPSGGLKSNDAYFVHSFGPNPSTMEEAQQSPYANEWALAELKEKQSFEHHNVLTVVPRSAAKGMKIFKPRPVLTLKVNPPTELEPHGSINKFKYRLTIAAFTKMLTQGIDYEEKHASTVRWNSVLMLIAIAVRHNFDIVLFDIKTFFLYGDLKDDVFMEQQPGWEPDGKPRSDYICKLNRSMYGLPQASHCAQKKLDKTMTGGGDFKRTSADDCVYVTQQGHPDKNNGYGALGAHVDDCLGIGDAIGLDKIKDTMEKEFEITQERNPSVITGVQVERNRDTKWLKLHQEAYVISILTDHKMLDCKSTDTPMDPGTARALMLLPTDQDDPVARKLYQRLVGCLIWLHKTRPDMMFTVNLLSRFLKKRHHAAL